MNSLPPNAPQDQSPDQAVDRVLHALGHAEPAAGMNTRLLANLEQHRTDTVRSPRWQFRWQGPVVAAALVLLLLAFTTTRLHRHSPENKQLADSQLENRQLAHSQLENSGLITEPDTQQLTSANNRLPEAKILSHNTSSLNPSRLAPEQKTKAADTTSASSRSEEVADLPSLAALDQAARDDMKAQSLAAPLLPPTPQERLVRLMLRHGEQRDLAQLDPGERTANFQQQREEFNKFFNPPTPAPEISIANRASAAHATSLQEVQEREALAHAVPTSSPSSQTPPGASK